MKSANFEFIRPHASELASLGGLAEAYAHPDPASALVKLRTFSEQLVSIVYERLKLPWPLESNLFDLLNQDAFRAAVPPVIISKLHSLRIQGNKAAHGDRGASHTALWILKEAYDLSRWLYGAVYHGNPAQCPEFIEPAPIAGEAKKADETRREVLTKLAAQEAQMQALLAELEATRTKAEAAERSAQELQSILSQGQSVANALHFDEKATRRHMIDAELIDAGWTVGVEGISTEEVAQEVTLPGETKGATEYADYVLYGADGKPLGVVEAKKTVISPESGRKQAELYANSLETKHGQRPIIFYTNGFEIYLWNDAVNDTPRKIHGFYSKDSLEYLIFQRHNRKNLTDMAPNPDIAGRMYQVEAVKRVAERFSQGHRRALVVQATGTGKTRVAISLCELLSRALWAKRILFVCDRRELRKQANNVFKEFLPGEPRTYVTADTAQDRDKRIYLATYPAMMKCFRSFDVGFFDLIIADESHRSIYNRYRDLFLYFDAFQVGLTATPIKFVNKNTYKLFGCEDQDPTFYYSYQEAINHTPPYLVPFEVFKATTEFMRRGIKYSQLSREQQQQLEEDEGEATSIDFEAPEIDRVVFNKDTNRVILRNLMENGIRESTGAHPGKSIIFARNHNHAILLQKLFDEMYPQYGGHFCRVIDNYDPRAEQLIDDFKGFGSGPGPTIAISIDMLDTGIDIPELVNLVFAKPVKSYVKFWQMIGRGTRLRKDLFGFGKDKVAFRIFDHWGNFEFFEEQYKETHASPQISLLQRLFDERLNLADTALDISDKAAFDIAIDLIAQDVADLPAASIPVKEKWREVHTVKQKETLQGYSPSTRSLLRGDIAPLMQWRNTEGGQAAYEFDLIVAKLETARLKHSAAFNDYKDALLALVGMFRPNVNQVRAKWDLIEKVRSNQFWEEVSVHELERVRLDLRSLIKLIETSSAPALIPKVLDVSEDQDKIIYERHLPKLEGLQLAAYRHRVEQLLVELIDDNAVLQKIRAGRPVSSDELEQLTALVLAQDANVNLNDLKIHFPDLADNLDIAIRSIIGMESEIVNARFEDFVRRHAEMSSKQIRFLSLLQNHIARFGSIEIERLYEPPFTTVDIEGIDGVFKNDEQINEILSIIGSFKRSVSGESLQS
jgi:type I restriction enzyme R subunit